MVRAGEIVAATFVGLAALALVPACAGDHGQPPATGDNTPAPTASLRLASGNVLDFYDTGRGALLMETADSYTRPAFSPAGRPQTADQLVEIWTSLAPNEPVPQALVDLQERLTNLPIDEDTLGAPGQDQGGATLDQPIEVQREGVLAAPSGCSNGCCDYDWLATFYECQVQNYPYTWFLYNYGWSWVNGTSILLYHGLVCAASGTTTYNLNIGGKWGGIWSVPEATWRNYHWFAGRTWWGSADLKNMTSAINSSSSTRLHTYCGHLAF